MVLRRASSLSPSLRSQSQSPNKSPQQTHHGSFHSRDSTGVCRTFLRSYTPLCVVSDHLLNDAPACLSGQIVINHSAAPIACSWGPHQQHTPPPSYVPGVENEAEELLQTLCNQDQVLAALDTLSHMHIPLSNNTYMCMLKACGKTKALPHIMHVYAHAARHRYELTGLLGDYLVISLAKCGAIEDACRVAQNLPVRTIFTWTALISAYADCGQGHEALEMHGRMVEEGVQPNHYTFVSLFKACGTILDLKQGRRLHSSACKKGLETDIFIENTLVSMYGKCNAVKETESMFGTLLKKDTVSWNVMLSTYVEWRKGEKALLLYRQMQKEGMNPDTHTIILALQACGILAEIQEATESDAKLVKVSSLEIGQALHADARKQGFMLDESLGNTLISVYGKCGALLEAESVFVSLACRHMMLWTALLATYVEQGQALKALRLYRQILEEGTSPERHLLVFALQATSIIEKEEEATARNTECFLREIREALHASARQKGLASDAFVVTTLVNLYGKSGKIEEARNAFIALSRRDIVPWTAMLSAYVEQGQGEEVLQLYMHIQREGICPDQHVYVISLQACCILAEKEEAVVLGEQFIKVRSLDVGEALHADVRRRGYVSNVFVCNALVIMYGKCGDIAQAEDVFTTMSLRNVVSWTAMLSAYVEQGHEEKALLLYGQIQVQSVILDDRVLLCMLQACSEIGSLEICDRLHFDIFSASYDTNVFIVASSIHAYGNCASMLDAQAIFEGLPRPDVASYTACASGYAGEGDSKASIHIFERLLLASIQPNSVTFTALFSACSHTGLVVLALEHFDFMTRDCRLCADLRHYGSLVDLLGRAGDFSKLEDLLRRMPLQADLYIWSCLLGACRIHGNLELGKKAFDRAVTLHPKEAAAYDLMINLYAEAGLQQCP